jgi:PKD repeat protein
MKQFIIIISALIFLAGCRKKDPVENHEPAVFSFYGKMNGNPVSFQSGINNYYMYSSFSTDLTNVREFTGHLKPFGCVSGCNNSLKIRIRDYRTLSSNPTHPDTSIAPVYYAYSKPSGAAASYNATFTPQFSGGTAQNYQWNFPDGSTSTSSTSIKSFSRNGQFNVCLNVTSTSSCVSSICNTAFAGQTGDVVQVAIYNLAMAGSAVSFTPVAITGTSPFTFHWDFGDGNTSTAMLPTHTYSAVGVFPVTLKITDANGRIGMLKKNVPTQSSGSCAAHFTYTTQPVANPLNLGNIVLEWTDSNGVVYTSEDNGQPGSSGFKIISVEEYKLNSSGQKTKKIKAVLNCTLYNGTSSLLVEDAELVFAVAYP